eukprot:COSAG01_NODE_4007_length_5440_cov_3.804531_7_plen_363_part_00
MQNTSSAVEMFDIVDGELVTITKQKTSAPPAPERKSRGRRLKGGKIVAASACTDDTVTKGGTATLNTGLMRLQKGVDGRLQVTSSKLVDTLVDDEANPDGESSSDSDGDNDSADSSVKAVNPLVEAARRGKYSRLRRMLMRGAIVDQDSAGRSWAHCLGSALLAASLNGQAKVIGLLLEAGASRDVALPNGRTALMMGAINGHLETTRLLLSGRAGRAGIDQRSVAGESALLIAAQNGHSSVVALLLEGGADPNLSNFTGGTALMASCAANRLECAVALLRGVGAANIDATDQGGNSALMVACSHGYAEVVRLLLTNGADTSLRNKPEFGGVMAFHIACAEGHTRCVDLVRQAHLVFGGGDD